ncbi:hypothetical protein GCM10029976_075140 [Kribbella albertanoniae]|uniref:Uncharacterized protein n=1 Tax=Kribbella albertanoniae TaxID=1266829 RepID=A0A4R4QBD5_9ACTN|nr:hypothetical protein E1261_08015 [Kribbella albertanoniae]
MVYGLVAVVLAVAGFVLPRWLAEQSGPELGETVVVTPGTAGPTAQPPSTRPRPTAPGAGPVSPAPVRTAGDDVDDGPDDTDDDGPDDDG